MSSGTLGTESLLPLKCCIAGPCHGAKQGKERAQFAAARALQAGRAAARLPPLLVAPAAPVPASPAQERQGPLTQSSLTPARVPPPQTPAPGVQAWATAAAARGAGGRAALAPRSLAGPPPLAPHGMRRGRRHGGPAGRRVRSRRGRGRGEAAGHRGRGPQLPAYRTSGA